MEVKQVLFIQGGGEDGYEVDKPLAAFTKEEFRKGIPGRLSQNPVR